MVTNDSPFKNREKEWRKNPRFDIDVKETYHIFQTYAPKIWDELIGMQDVLNLPTKQIILNFGHYFTDLKTVVVQFLRGQTI